MTRKEIRALNRERLASWAERLADDDATAWLVVGAGHGERAGEIHLCIPDAEGRHEELFSREQLIGILRGAARMLESNDPVVREDP